LVDKWQGHNKHNEKKSRKLLKKADIIFCEWCLGNVKWYSMNKLPNQRLVARFHLQEKNLPYLGEANLSAIDHISYVSEQLRWEANGVVKFDEGKSSVIANLLDESNFTARKKMGDARFTLGIVGISPKRKRVDLALDTLELLLEQDSRYMLRIKGKHPFDYLWLMNRPEELEYYMEIMKRINSSETLRYKVIFDPEGDDVDQWFTMVGFILSPSDFESFHMTVGEGMLTGAIPVVWDWDGASVIWPKDSIVKSPKEAADNIHSVSIDSFQEKSINSRNYVLENYATDDSVRKWCEVLESPE
jgi:glycosyltransferase involved in cell wall biosynthesis